MVMVVSPWFHPEQVQGRSERAVLPRGGGDQEAPGHHGLRRGQVGWDSTKCDEQDRAGQDRYPPDLPALCLEVPQVGLPGARLPRRRNPQLDPGRRQAGQPLGQPQHGAGGGERGAPSSYALQDLVAGEEVVEDYSTYSYPPWLLALSSQYGEDLSYFTLPSAVKQGP